MKSEKAVTLMTLAITVVVLIILTFTVTVNIDQYSDEKNRTNFEVDMKNLKEEIDQYYAREKKLPIINKFTNVSMLDSIKNLNDNENYYVIDIDKLNIELNYGVDYSIISQKEETEEITDLLDVYIINSASHTIYYPKGIEYNENIHYTIKEIYNEIEVEQYVNKPRLLEGMTPIKFTMPTNELMGTVVETTETDEDWYEYGTTYETRRWANVKTKDGSMWVWIPRYAYKITYYTDNTKTQVSQSKTTYGSIDVVFLIGDTDNYYDENGDIKTAKRQNVADKLMDTTKDYTVHPAFTDESKIDYANGGWDKEITGIWVAKFEAGYASGNNDAEVKASSVNYTQTMASVSAKEAGTSSESYLLARNWLDGIYGETVTSIKYPTFQGKTYAMNYINMNDAYNISRTLTNEGNIYGLNSLNTDSHLMKNSEWGAVAYLAYSKYGQNGTEIKVNNITLNSGNAQRTETSGKSGVDSVYAVTGCTTNETTRGGVVTTIERINTVTANNPTIDTYGVYVWNQKTGQNSSTTGTIYGIYDISGSVWEKTSSFVSNGDKNLLTHGKSLLDETNVTYNMEDETISANTGTSTKYVTIYTSDDSKETVLDTASQKNYVKNIKIYGDAIRETTHSNAGTSNEGWNTSSWDKDHSAFPALNCLFFDRGGSIWSANNAGLFAFSYTAGNSRYINGFRTVLIAK